jgi:DNA polymerase-1
VNFGVMYGLSAFGLSRRLKIGHEEAAKFIDDYYDRHPKVEAFFEAVLAAAEKNRGVTTILGRRRPITGVKRTVGRSRNLAERTAINTVIQGSAADLIKQAMVNLYRRLRPERDRIRMLLQIHDELVFEVRKSDAAKYAKIVAEEMTTALPMNDVPIEVDVGVGPNWLDLEPLDFGASR